MQVQLLDNAIKSVIFNQPNFGSRTYSRFELLELKKNCNKYEPPVFVIDRLLKGKNGQNLICHGYKSDHVYFSQCDSQSDNSRKDGNAAKSPRNCSISFSKKINGVQSKKGLRDKRNDAREFSDDLPDKSDKPAWYIEGPTNIEDQIDFDDMKIPQFHDQAICKIVCIDSPIKSSNQEANDALCIGSTIQENMSKISHEPVMNAANPPIKSKQEKTIRVHTLREIESDLRVRKVDDDISDDLAAFNKLLAIVGLKHNIGNPREQPSDSPILNMYKAVDKGDSVENEKIIFQNQKDFCAPSEGSLNTPENVHNSKSLNSCTGRYPAHLLNQANIGHTYRWLRAMTNAASASAFICQKMDSFNSLDSDSSRISQNSGTLGQNTSYDLSYEEVDNDPLGDMMQPMDGYEYVPHGSAFPNSLGYPVGASMNRLTSRLYNPIDFQNGNKFLARQPLQPFFLQQLLHQQQQQQLAKPLQLLSLRNSAMSFIPGYQQPQVHPLLYPHHTNSNAANHQFSYHPSYHHQPAVMTKAQNVSSGAEKEGLENPTSSAPDVMSGTESNQPAEGPPVLTGELEC